MSLRTAGPWRIGDAGRTVFGPPNGNPAPEVVAAGLTRANARLIAAAPELYAALRIVLEDVATHPSGKLCLPRATVEAVRDALTKADGPK